MNMSPNRPEGPKIDKPKEEEKVKITPPTIELDEKLMPPPVPIEQAAVTALSAPVTGEEEEKEYEYVEVPYSVDVEKPSESEQPEQPEQPEQVEQLEPVQSEEEIEIGLPSDAIFLNKKERNIFFAFITPPIAISIISMLHMVTLFQTANSFWMSVMIAVSVEMAAIASLVALATLKKLSRGTVWTIFGVLAFLQVLGNMYHAYVNMSPESFDSIMTLFGIGERNIWSIRLVTFMISGILPIISLTFVKGVVEYFRGSEKKKEEEEE